MNERTMTVRQLMVLASELGAEHFYGMRDPFGEEDPAQVHAAYASILTELEASGGVSLGFDGSVVVDETLAALVRACAFCTRYVTVEQILCGEPAPLRNIYLHEGRAVCLEAGAGRVRLCEISPEETARLALREVLAGCGAQEESESAFCVRQQTLALCAQRSEQGLRELRAAGMQPELAQLLADGVRQRANYCCLSAVDLEKRTLQSVCVVYDAQRLALLEPDTREIDGWQVRTLTPQTLCGQVGAMTREAVR